MPAQTLLQPRKSPVQARSTASVDAMLEATLQVLVSVGKERLTTTRVAMRAGVSVGTLYQYFPNKSSLLQAALSRHFEGVITAVEEVCTAQRGCPLATMARALVSAFLRAKMKDGPTSVALYAVSSDVDGISLAQQAAARMHRMVADVLATASDGPPRDIDLVTSLMVSAMSGVSRRLLESKDPARNFEPYCQELEAMVTSYLQQCPRQTQPARSGLLT